MKNGLCPLLIIAILVSGCDGETDLDPAPYVVKVSVEQGYEIPSNAFITVLFSEEMDTGSVAISLNGIQVPATSHDGMTITTRFKLKVKRMLVVALRT